MSSIYKIEGGVTYYYNHHFQETPEDTCSVGVTESSKYFRYVAKLSHMLLQQSKKF